MIVKVKFNAERLYLSKITEGWPNPVYAQQLLHLEKEWVEVNTDRLSPDAVVTGEVHGVTVEGVRLDLDFIEEMREVPADMGYCSNCGQSSPLGDNCGHCGANILYFTPIKYTLRREV